MKARLEKEIRLKQLEEARRMELESQEKQRRLLAQDAAEAKARAEELAKQQAAAEAKKKPSECSGPTARFKASCR